MGSIPITRSNRSPIRVLGTRRPARVQVIPLYEARDRLEAQLLKDYLDGHRVGSVVLRDALSGAAGELPTDIGPTLWLLDDDDLDRARGLLSAFLEPASTSGGDLAWVCPACGEPVEANFDVCWNCSRPRD